MVPQPHAATGEEGLVAGHGEKPSSMLHPARASTPAQVFDVNSADPLTLIVVALLLIAVAIAAAAFQRDAPVGSRALPANLRPS